MTKNVAPAADRNKAFILEVLEKVLPEQGVLLEIASGSGQHVVHFARALPKWRFIPSDPTASARASIAAWIAEEGLPNIEPPRAIDVRAGGWETSSVDAILCINMVHIAPFEAAQALFAGAAQALATGPLVLYGPYRFSGEFLAESNAEFDRSLRARDPSWGVRDVDDLDATAAAAGLARTDTFALPANNHVLVYRRGPRAVAQSTSSGLR